MAKFLMELCLPEFPMLEFTPSRQAAAAIYVAKLVHVDYSPAGWVGQTKFIYSGHLTLLKLFSPQTPTLQYYTSYCEADILPCVYKMAKLVQNMAKAKQQAVKNKYASSKLMRTSKCEGLFSEEMQKLASKAN